MRPLKDFSINLRDCLADLNDFNQLLATHSELRENEHVLPFFREHPHLAAYIGFYSPTLTRFDKFDIEYPVHGSFRADAIVGDTVNRSYCFIEFEDGASNSIFKKPAGAPRIGLPALSSWNGFGGWIFASNNGRPHDFWSG